MKYSVEQQNIIDVAKSGKNIICNAVAGAGKTTTLLGIARSMPTKSCIQITYNRKLKQEVREKVLAAGIENMEISNYHAVCLHYYGNHTDNHIIDVGKNRIKPVKVLERLFDVCIIDEAQDMTPEYYDFLRIFTRDFCIEGFQMIILGDEMQSVYDFKLASPGYLVAADKYWPEKEFVRLTMSQSFRITPEIASIINHLRGKEIITSAKSKSNIAVTLLSSYNHGCHSELTSLIDKIYSGDLKSEDLMIILPSADASHATSFINRLVKAGISIYKQSDFEESSNEKYSRGKVLVCTFHTSKGLERNTVIIFNFDVSYYTIYQPEKLIDELIPTLYVGMTRAIKRLFLVENGERLPYVSPSALKLMEVPKSRGKCRSADPYTRETFDIRRLIKFLPSQLLYDISIDLESLFTEIVPEKFVIKIPKDIKGYNGKKEFVADLTAIGILDYFEYLKTNDCRSLQIIEHFAGNTHASQDKINEEVESIEDVEYDTKMGKFLQLANLAEVCRSGHFYRYKQICNYDWISDENLEKILNRLQNRCPNGKIRALFGKELVTSQGKRSIYGEIYSFTQEHIYEAFLAKEFDVNRKLITVFHAWILESFLENPKKTKYEIENLLTGQVFLFTLDMNIISRICTRIINWKFA